VVPHSRELKSSSVNYPLIRRIIGFVSGALLGALVLGSNMQPSWVIAGAVLGSIIGLILGPRIGAWLDDVRARGGVPPYSGGGPYGPS
jgi:hypothetical protein